MARRIFYLFGYRDFFLHNWYAKVSSNWQIRETSNIDFVY